MPDSERLQVARLARDTALTVPGVRDTDAGPGGLSATGTGDARVRGVTCTSAGDGAYDLALRLVCELVPLRPLAELVRTRVGQSAGRAGFAVARVTVHVVRIAEAAGAGDTLAPAGPAPGEALPRASAEAR